MPKEEPIKLAYPENYPLHDGEVWLITLENAKTGQKVKIPLIWALDEIHAKSTPIKEE